MGSAISDGKAGQFQIDLSFMVLMGQLS